MKYLWMLIFLGTSQFTTAFFGLTKHFNTHQEPQFKVSKSLKQLPIEKWIEQKLDNFNPQDNRRWKMRYYEDLSNLETGGPIFIYLGGEWTITPGSIMEGTLIHEMAHDAHGALFYTEHRFYGQSRPTQNTTTENLRFLSLDQSMADVAYFIKYIRSSSSQMNNSKVILVGASYSGKYLSYLYMN